MIEYVNVLQIIILGMCGIFVSLFGPGAEETKVSILSLYSLHVVYVRMLQVTVVVYMAGEIIRAILFALESLTLKSHFEPAPSKVLTSIATNTIMSCVILCDF